MSRVQGVETRRFGEWLTGRATGGSFLVYYDHGDKLRHSNVAAIKAFAGNAVANANRLADLDVLVAKDRAALLLVEIEERPLSPKKVLGDVLAVMLSDRVAVLVHREQQYFDLTPATRLVIAGAVPDAGDRVDKIREIIAPRLKAISGQRAGLDPKNVELMFSGWLTETLDTLKLRTEEILGETI